jgi:hypothetical protein
MSQLEFFGLFAVWLVEPLTHKAHHLTMHLTLVDFDCKE